MTCTLSVERVAGIRLDTGENTGLVCLLQMWKIWANKSGTQKASRSWAHHSGLMNSCPKLLQRECKRGAIEWVPDLQAAWQILAQCAGARCHHLLRTHCPRAIQQCAILHGQEVSACRFATLAMRMKGFGLRLATRMAPAGLVG